MTTTYESIATHLHPCICGGSLGCTDEVCDQAVEVTRCGSCMGDGYDPTETLIPCESQERKVR